MATNINTILNWFMTGKKPTQAQFWASWGSFWHKDETIPQSSISELTTVLNAKTENDQFNAHKTDANAHADLFASKEDKNKKGVANGYVPLNEFVQIASQYLQITDDLITGGHDSLLSAEQGKNLQIQIDGINTLLTSDDINLDTVQEIVDAIETVQTSLSTILVNDLTTGGTTKALTAEMGKILKILVDSLSTNKLEKGGYAGTAQQLKTEIDDIYQPDVLIRSVPPTRVGDTFTYPVGEYEYILSKVHHINAANFSVTIPLATINYKRTDLIYAKPDNSLAKLGGTESLTVAIRPDVPVGCVGISFINVFGATISDPTPIDNQISIQDSLGVEKFKINDYIRFKGFSFSASSKQIEVDPLSLLSAYLDTVSGADNIATINNSAKPFKTLEALLTALPVTTGETYTVYLMNGNVNVLRRITTRNLNWVAYKSTIIDFSLCMEADGTTHAQNILQGSYTYNTWTFLNSNISIINNYVGVKCFGFNSDQGLVLKGNIDTFNWKSQSGFSFKGTPINAGSDIIFNNVYDSPQDTLVLTNQQSNYDIRIKNYYAGYNRSIGNRGRMVVDNIFKVGGASQTITICGSGGSLVLGNVNLDNSTLNIGAGASKVTFNGTITDTTVVNLTGVELITGTVKTNAYMQNSWVGNTQVFSNFVGKINDFLVVSTGQLIFENCIVDCNTRILRKWGASTASNGSSRDDIIVCKGFNVFTQANTSGDLLYADTGVFSGYSPNIILTDAGTIKLNALSYGKTVNYINTTATFKEKLNERIIRSKYDLINRVLSSTTAYIIDGTITLLSGEYIEVPLGGLTLTGYGFDVSQVNKNIAGQSIFISPAGNSGNLVTRDIQYNSGVGTVFNITDSDGSHAIELNDVNFQSCSFLGTFNGYRQFTATTCGFYGCSDGFTLEGTWNGFKITNSNVIGFGASGTFIKKGASTSFNNRLYIDLNMSIATGSKICDFQDSNFASNKLLQVVNCLVKVNGVIDSTTTSATFPNISPFSSKAYFTNNIGVKNSFNEPYGLKTTNLATYANDTDAATGNVQVGEVYIETATGYFKARLV